MPDLGSILPRSLVPHARWERLGPTGIPVLLVHPDTDFITRAPIMLWMHGRTVNKELDPGRYLRWMRSGIAACAIDLPGHGERSDPLLREPEAAYEVVMQMAGEVDLVVEELAQRSEFETGRVGIGGMSAGGMAVIVRLCEPHQFRCGCLEATSGSWQHQRHRAMFSNVDPAEIEARNPMGHLADWREIPLQAIHTKADEWIDFEGQEAFIEGLRGHYKEPDLIEFISYERTGAPFEHAGFGRFGSEAKNRQVEFLRRYLANSGESVPRS